MVYRARDRTTSEHLAVKTVKAPSPAAFAGLRQEIEFLRNTHHPGVVRILDFEVGGGDPWYAMELLEGQTLADHNRSLWASQPGRRQLLRPEVQTYRTLVLYARICEPLAFVHANGIVHCDLKPTNVFLRSADQPVLMDFGLVTQSRGSIGREVLDVSGRLRGTLPYMAPEVLCGQIPDARTDVYALGCMLFETLTGRPPFVANAIAALIDMHLNAASPLISEYLPGAPAELNPLLERLLEKRPSQRFGHVGDLARTLWALAERIRPVDEVPAAGPAPTTSSPPQLFRSAVIGRDRELSFLSERVDRALERGSIIVVTGESGIGKTFLAAEAAQRALLKSAAVVTGECVSVSTLLESPEQSGSPPLAPFRRLFESIRDQCRERGARECERLVGKHLGLLARYSPALAALPGAAEATVPGELPPAAARERVLAALSDVVSRFADGRCLLIAIDDLQWADDLKLGFLAQISEEYLRKTPVVLLATCRTDEMSDAVKLIVGKPHTQRIHLERLPKPDVAALIGGMLSMPAPPATLVDIVHRQAEGIPFFAAESLRALVTEGALLHQQGIWNMDSSHAALTSGVTPFPGHLEELLRQRLARLLPGTVATLEAAAVYGREFPLEILTAVSGGSPDEVGEYLEEASARQIIEPRPAGRFCFLHDKLREGLCARIPPERNRQLHGAVARAIESSQPEPAALQESYAQLAHHYRESGEDRAGRSYLFREGRRARPGPGGESGGPCLPQRGAQAGIQPARPGACAPEGAVGTRTSRCLAGAR